MRHSMLAGAFALLLTAALLPSWAAEPVTLTFDQPQTAGISGFRAKWDTPLPGALVFDAVHRSLLVRFPGAAEAIAAQVGKGYAVQKVELVLPFDDTELWTSDIGYEQRTSFGGTENYQQHKPTWHAVAWALRKPWMADKETGPTFNAFINGAGYWTKFGAQDSAKDRFPQQFGPTEVSYQQTTGSMDVTPVLADAGFGASLAARLRTLEDNGFMLRKWEIYDYRFRKAGDGAYEWQVATGGRGIKIKPPRLVVTFTPANAPAIGKLAPAADIPALATDYQTKKTGGAPTAVMPTPEQLQALIDKYALKRPAWMPDWQWQRVAELDKLGGGYRLPRDPAGYAKWIDNMLAEPPRYWNGWDVPDRLLVWYLYKDALPAPVREHWINYWTAWLMPDRPTKDLVHAQAVELYYGGKNKYYEDTGDWRGNASFFRDGYCYQMSTMNFNHTAAMGALLGGNIIGSQYAMQDGRHGLEYWPLRTWCWYDGSTQESIDHYYFGLTLSDQKMFADFGPTAIDRMMGKIMLAKSVEELTSAYHPALRHFIASSTRTSAPEYLLATQDALQHIVHTLSHSGALHDVGNTQTSGYPVIGQDTPPGRVAQQTVTGPWAPEWVANMVDEKPLPYEMTNAYKQWGGHAANPLWRRTYLGHDYGIGSTDVYSSVVPIMAQWRREDKPVATVQDLGTLTLRYGVNDTQLASTVPGWMEALGSQAVLHEKNKMIVVTSPFKMSGREGVKSLQSTIGFFNLQPQPTWEIYLDGQRVTLPCKAKQGQRITIKDGVTFLGIIPLPATDLGRTDEVVIQEGTEQPNYPNYKIKPALVINSYNLQRDTPLPKDADWGPIDLAYGGFVVEFGDVTEYRTFADFQQHMAGTKLETRWEPEKVTYHVAYTSGKDLLETGVFTNYRDGAQTPSCFAYRRVNGNWPYLLKGLERDTNLTQQGSTGRLEKNGAVLTCEPGRMAYLQTEPISGTYAGFNPLPDATLWTFSVPGNITVKADGRLGLARVIVRPKENKLWIDYAVKDDQHTRDMATALLVFGLKSAPAVILNDQPLKTTPQTVKTADGLAYVIPLADVVDMPGMPARYARAQQVFQQLQQPAGAPEQIKLFPQDWAIVGPFPNVNETGFDIAYGPEKGPVDLQAAYPGINNTPVTWKRVLAPGQPALGPGSVNLLRQFTPHENVCAYAYTTITSDQDRDVTLFTGSDDTITAWLNGEKVLAKNVYRGANIDEDKTDIKLKKGVNSLLVKICQSGGGWEFYLRVADEYGRAIDGVRYGAAQ